MARFPTLDEATEASLLERARGSSRERDEVLAALFRQFREPVLALCVHVIGDIGEAEDVVQQVFLAVHRSLPRFRGEARVSTWIYRIALRAAVTARAQRKVHDSIELHADQAGPSTESELVLRDQARRIASAMDRLPIEHRAVLSLFALEGLSHREIADILGVPEGTIWSRLSSARKKLVAELTVSPNGSPSASRTPTR